MMRLQGNRYSKMLVPVLLLVVVLFAFSDQALAAPLASRAAQPGKPPAFTCVNKPAVQAPPFPTLQSGLPSVAAPPRAACPTGQVPQPTAHSSAKQQPHAPVPAGAQIAAGYHYVTGFTLTTALGAEANFSQHAPFLAPGDNHTLAELAVISGNGQQIVEIGWTVDRVVNNGDSNPHLFVFHWTNGHPFCYNGCGYVQYSSSFGPGMAVTSDGSAPLYAIEFYQGNWWLWYGIQWIGYFPGSLWNNAFTSAQQEQFFGEISSGGAAGTQMGDGIFGSQVGSASISNAAILDSSLGWKSTALAVSPTDPACYDSAFISSDQSSFRYGGPDCVRVVPSVLSDDPASATAAITGAGLTVGTIFEDNRCIEAADTVVAQDPSSGTVVAPGSAVDLWVSSGVDRNGQPCVFL